MLIDFGEPLQVRHDTVASIVPITFYDLGIRFEYMSHIWKKTCRVLETNNIIKRSIQEERP